MALGELLLDEIGTITGVKVLPATSEGANYEVCLSSSGEMRGTKNRTNWTYAQIVRTDGSIYGAGDGVMTTECGEVFYIKPDLILCDIAMPELSGYEICAMLRNSTAFHQTPIIMLTGIEGFIDRVKARIVGATHYLTKPFGENELLMLVEKYIGPGLVEGPDNNRIYSKNK